MLAVEVRVNGELKGVCGAGELEHLMAWFSAERKGAHEAKDYEFILQCQGHVLVDPETNEALKWVHARMKFGDEVTLQFVDATAVHQPIDRQRYPSRAIPPDA